MWKQAAIVLCVILLFAGCVPEKQETAPAETAEMESLVEVPAEIIEEPAPETEEPAPVEKTVEESKPDVINEIAEEMQAFPASPEHWTLNRQKTAYDAYFAKQELDMALDFRLFIESLAQYHHNEPVYEYNPVFLCYEKYPEILPLIHEVKPELFLRGNIDFGSYSKSPIVYVLENYGLDEVKFYFENNIPFLDVREDLLYGTLNRGGPRFGLGGNILSYAKAPDVIAYMIFQGVPCEVNASSSFVYYLNEDSVYVFSEPGFYADIVGTLYADTAFKVLSVLTCKVDDFQWVKLSFDDCEGWIPSVFLDYDTGI